MEGPPLGPGGEDITWPDQVAPRGRKASSTRKIKPQTSNLKPLRWWGVPAGGGRGLWWVGGPGLGEGPGGAGVGWVCVVAFVALCVLAWAPSWVWGRVWGWGPVPG